MMTQEITLGLSYQSFQYLFENIEATIHLIEFQQGVNQELTLLLSKASEAILPNTKDNHIGEGATLDNIIQKQRGIRFIINGGFNHYRKEFYDWSHKNFNIGDPVGIVKIREHFYEDYLNLEHYGFLVQTTKGKSWNILTLEDISINDKYILGCTPLLIFNQKSRNLPYDIYCPVNQGIINPPSYLGHGLQHHPRTAIGQIGNQLYFLIVEGKGCTLPQLQELGHFLKMDSLLNLDGGGSSQFRLFSNHNTYSNFVSHEDKNRILGHTLIIFDEQLK